MNNTFYEQSYWKNENFGVSEDLNKLSGFFSTKATNVLEDDYNRFLSKNYNPQTPFYINPHTLSVLSTVNKIFEGESKKISPNEVEEFIKEHMIFRIENKILAELGATCTPEKRKCNKICERCAIGYEILTAFTPSTDLQLGPSNFLKGNRVYIDGFMRGMEKLGDRYGRILIKLIIDEVSKYELDPNKPLTINTPRTLITYAVDLINDTLNHNYVKIEALEAVSDDNDGLDLEDFVKQVEYALKKGILIHPDDCSGDGVWTKEIITDLCNRNTVIEGQTMPLIHAIKIDKLYIWGLLGRIINGPEEIYKMNPQQLEKLGNLEEKDLSHEAREFGHFINSLQNREYFPLEIYIEGVENSGIIKALIVIFGNDKFKCQGYLFNKAGSLIPISNIDSNFNDIKVVKFENLDYIGINHNIYFR